MQNRYIKEIHLIEQLGVVILQPLILILEYIAIAIGILPMTTFYLLLDMYNPFGEPPLLQIELLQRLQLKLILQIPKQLIQHPPLMQYIMLPILHPPPKLPTLQQIHIQRQQRKQTLYRRPIQPHRFLPQLHRRLPQQQREAVTE